MTDRLDDLILDVRGLPASAFSVFVGYAPGCGRPGWGALSSLLTDLEETSRLDGQVGLPTINFG